MSFTVGDNGVVSFLSLPFSGGGSDYLSFLLFSSNFHYTGDILSVLCDFFYLAACPLSSFFFFSQNCIAVIRNFVRCV